MSQTILALRLKGSRRIDPAEADALLASNIALEQTPLAQPSEGEAVVEPIYVSVCGSDGSASLGKPHFDWVERPRTIGHEFSGQIVAMGPGADACGLKIGELVTAIPQRGCGDSRCRGCRRGRWNYCRRKQILGFHRDGAMAQRVVLEADRLVAVRPGLTPLQGAVIEPLSVVAQAVHRKCNIQPGMSVVVSGCGIIGLMAAEVARAAGGRVIVTGLERDRGSRLALAEGRGFATLVVSPERPLHEQLAAGVVDARGVRIGDEYDNGAVDVLIECSGAPAALAAAPLSMRPEGTICVIATYATAPAFEATTFTRSGLTMTGVMGSSRDDFETAQTLLRDGVFPVEEYATIYPLQRAVEAIADSIAARVAKAIVEVSSP